MNQKNLTQEPVLKTMFLFALPLILGNLLQQGYNVVDTWVVGRFIGSDALAAVGSAFALMTFLTSILLEICMGSGVVFSIYFGRKDEEELKNSLMLCIRYHNFILYTGISSDVVCRRMADEDICRCV